VDAEDDEEADEDVDADVDEEFDEEEDFAFWSLSAIGSSSSRSALVVFLGGTMPEPMDTAGNDAMPAIMSSSDAVSLAEVFMAIRS